MLQRCEQSEEYRSIESLEQREDELEKLERAHALVKRYTICSPDPDARSLSSKVSRLRGELSERSKSDSGFRGIVFVDQRFAALSLYDCFERLKIPGLRPGVLLGNSMESAVPKAHRQTLDHFRAGLVNLIFATSVADEGIDIPQCNLCVRFDLYKSPIQYMQSRGRARMENSIYAHMIEEMNLAQKSAVRYAIESDAYIKDFCQSLPSDRLLGHGTKLERLIAQDKVNKSFKTGSGAICDFGNCLLILSKFATSLRHIGAVEHEIYKEEIDEESRQFRCIVRLPMYPVTQVKGARGYWRPNKQLAKRSAAFNCCFILRSKGLLDEQLQSRYQKVKPDNLNARMAVTQKKASYPMIVKPAEWSETVGTVPIQLFATLISFGTENNLRRPLAPMCLLTRQRLPDLPAFSVFLEDNIRTGVKFQQLSQPFNVSAAEMHLLTVFTLDGIFFDVFNKRYETNPSHMTYWVAPTTPQPIAVGLRLDDLVDMQAMHAVQAGRLQWSPENNLPVYWSNKFICDPRSGKFRYFSRDVNVDVKAFDPVPDEIPNIPQKSRDSIINFSDSYWKSSKKNFAAANWDPDQVVLDADLVPARRNLLIPTSKKWTAYTKCLIAPQALEVSRLHPALAASCFVWPVIIHKIEAYMIALRGVEQAGLRGIPAGLALEAFTKDTDADEVEGQPSFDGQYDIGKSYERLEFIGDSLLKMMATITVFLRTDCDEEGMHCRRMEIICNRRLYEVSTNKHHLYSYARTAGFARDTWYPEYVTLLKGRGAKNPPEVVRHPEATQQLSMKTIADMSEALIGAAAVATQYLPNRFDLGIQAITLLVDSPDHAIRSWSDLSMMYKAPSWSLIPNDVLANNLATQILERTGYRFRFPRLLRSAFTHSSDTYSIVPDLQRLEFLGDAILDWVSISWLFNTNHNRGPHWLTEHKMAMVSNRFLAALAVTLDFDKFLQTSAIPVISETTKYAQKVREQLADPGLVPEFWMEIDSPPKALSDLVESYLGAVFIDSEFDYQEIEKFFNNHILWFFKDISRYDGFASSNPTSYLYKHFYDEFRCQNFQILNSEPIPGRIETSITAGVLIHGRVLASAKAANARVAKVKASKVALETVEGMTREDFARKFDCDCKSKRS